MRNLVANIAVAPLFVWLDFALDAGRAFGRLFPILLHGKRMVMDAPLYRYHAAVGLGVIAVMAVLVTALALTVLLLEPVWVPIMFVVALKREARRS